MSFTLFLIHHTGIDAPLSVMCMHREGGERLETRTYSAQVRGRRGVSLTWSDIGANSMQHGMFLNAQLFLQHHRMPHLTRLHIAHQRWQQHASNEEGVDENTSSHRKTKQQQLLQRLRH